jgi:aminoglycoside 6'-N-acetyltransferase
MASDARPAPDPAPFAFRPLATGDLPLLHRWLTNPAVYRWYGGSAPSFAEVAAKYAPRTAGHSPTRPFLILRAGAPIGYIQTYRVAAYPEYAALAGDGAAGAAAIDLFIGEDAQRGRGLGAAILRAFLRAVVFADPAITHCFIDPHPDNTVAIRAYARAGFRPIRRCDPPPPAEPCLLMRLDRAEMEGA